MPEYQKKLETIADHFGLQNQVYKLYEEMSELAVALTHHDMENIVEEIADVKIMLAQLEYLFDVKDKVKGVVDYKIERTLTKIA